ncbi:unnamed protein product, partial [Symbiodinium sp. KB8]
NLLYSSVPPGRDKSIKFVDSLDFASSVFGDQSKSGTIIGIHKMGTGVGTLLASLAALGLFVRIAVFLLFSRNPTVWQTHGFMAATVHLEGMLAGEEAPSWPHSRWSQRHACFSFPSWKLTSHMANPGRPRVRDPSAAQPGNHSSARQRSMLQLFADEFAQRQFLARSLQTGVPNMSAPESSPEEGPKAKRANPRSHYRADGTRRRTKGEKKARQGQGAGYASSGWTSGWWQKESSQDSWDTHPAENEQPTVEPRPAAKDPPLDARNSLLIRLPDGQGIPRLREQLEEIRDKAKEQIMRIMIQAQQEPPATAGSSGTQVVQLQPTGTEGADPPAPEPPSLHLSAPPGPRAIVETALDASPPTTPRRASEQPGDGQLALTADTGDAEVAAGLSQPDPTVSGDATSAYMLSALARGRERSSFTGALQLLSASPRPMQQDRTLTSRTSRSRSTLISAATCTSRASTCPAFSRAWQVVFRPSRRMATANPGRGSGCSGVWRTLPWQVVSGYEVTFAVCAIIPLMQLPALVRLPKKMMFEGDQIEGSPEESAEYPTQKALVISCCMALQILRSLSMASIEAALSELLYTEYHWGRRVTGIVTAVLMFSMLPAQIAYESLALRFSVNRAIRFLLLVALCGSGLNLCGDVFSLLLSAIIVLPSLALSSGLIMGTMQIHCIPNSYIFDLTGCTLFSLLLSDFLGRGLGPQFARMSIARGGQHAFGEQQLLISSVCVVVFATCPDGLFVCVMYIHECFLHVYELYNYLFSSDLKLSYQQLTACLFRSDLLSC